MSDDAEANAVLRTILERRSVRNGYRPEPVERALIEQVVAGGLAAPSSKNARPWRLHVVSDRDRLDALAAAAESADEADDYVPPDPLTGLPSPLFQSTVLESAAVLRQAPCAILLENRGVYIRDIAWLAGREPQVIARMLTAYGLEVMGLGTALENMWLSASSLGLSAAFLGDLAIASPAARTLFGLEGDLVGVLVIGRSDTAPFQRREPPPITQSDSPVVWH